MTSRLCTIVLIAAVANACATAPRARTFPELPRYLDPGSTIQLTDVNGTKTTGRLESLSPASLAIVANGTRREVADREVLRIKRPARRVGRGALLGFSVGLVLGLTLPGSEPAPEYALIAAEGAALEAVVLATLGTVVGAIGGVFIKGSRTVYETTPVPSTRQAERRAPTTEDTHVSPARAQSSPGR